MAPCGWDSDLPTFYGTAPRIVRLRLQDFVRDSSPEQVRAWDASIPLLQRECAELVRCEGGAAGFTAILEYELPRESRRPDVVILENGVVVVLELKGKEIPSPGDIDQVFAYARDLRSYHAACDGRPVHAVLVPSRRTAPPTRVDEVTIAGPAHLHRVLLDFTRASAPPLSTEAFLRGDAYAPLPSLVRAARELFTRRTIPRIWRAAAATDPAVERITAIAHDAAKSRTRRLVLLTGVPGAGKTLVGLRLVHAGFLDDLAVPRPGGRPSAPAVFLSGNGPLVEVLQHALRDAGGGGKIFVRAVREYVRTYASHRGLVPPEHLVVFDEAQRAWDAEHMAHKHRDREAGGAGLSEPEHFVEFAQRIPEWAVVVGLVGSGQEIHAGEEGGIAQWRRALERLPDPGAWHVHAPAALAEAFHGAPFRAHWEPALNLTTEIRYHLAPRLHEFVSHLLDEGDAARARRAADQLHASGMRLRVTRDLEAAKAYARDRYADHPEARYGLLASSKAKNLGAFGVANDFRTTRALRVGPWYNAPPGHPDSCCRLDRVATEFSSQGLELDLGVLAWGSDFARSEGRWSIERA